MDNNLSVTGHAFNLQYGDASGSKRNDANAAANEPRSLVIQHQDYVDSSTKVKGRRTILRLEKTVLNDDTGQKSKLVTQLVMQIPEDSEIDSSAITGELAILELLLGVSGLKAAVFANSEQ